MYLLRVKTWMTLALGVLFACNSTHNPVTANGTVIVDWDTSKATRAGFAKATIGPRTAKDFVVEVTQKDTPPFELDLHVDVAPIDFEEGGKTVHQTAAVAVKATVKENTGWDLSGKCDDGPNYQMGPVDDAGAMHSPAAMIQDCPISEHRTAGAVLKSTWAIGFTLNIYGDGTVKAFPADGVKIRPK